MMDGPVLVDARGRQHGSAPAVRCAPAANCWLHVSGIDRFVDAEEAAAALRTASECDRVEMALFAADSTPPYVERRVRDQGKQHQGWALLRFLDPAAASAAAVKLTALRCAALGASRLCAAPARSRAELDAAAAAAEAERAAAAAAARERQRAHNQRRRARARERSTAEITALISLLPPPGGLLAAQRFVALDSLALPHHIDWEAMPEAARPDAALGCGERVGPTPAGATAGALAARVARKRAQVESFAAVLRAMLQCEDSSASPRHLTIVDFGCGSGGLVLPLAVLFPEHAFVGVDMLSASVELLRARAAAAGLHNVRGEVGMIERYAGACDVALGLHACGNATDFVVAQATLRRCAFAICPCCIGKLRFGLAGGSSFSAHVRDLPSLAPGLNAEDALPAPEHPRSAWMRRALPSGDDGAARRAAFAALAAAADVSHGEAAEQAAQAAGFCEAATAAARAAKLNIELDRAEGARDSGYAVATLKLFDAAATAKNDLLVGAPRDTHPLWAQVLDALMATAGG